MIPILTIEHPVSGTRVNSDAELVGNGWVVAPGKIDEISIWVNGLSIGFAVITGPRRDLGDRAPVPTGFTFSVTLHHDGPLRLVFRAVGKPGADVIGTLQMNVVARGIGVSRQQTGFVDYYGYSRSCRGWLVGGWIPNDLSPETLAEVGRVTSSLRFGDDELNFDKLTIALFGRGDIEAFGRAFLLYVAADPVQAGPLLTVEVETVAGAIPFRTTARSERLGDPAIVVRARHDLATAMPSEPVATLNRLFTRSGYTGENTIDRMAGIYLAVDEAIQCATGILLIGWLFDPKQDIADMVLHRGDAFQSINSQRIVKTERPDVAQGFAEHYGRVETACGFVTFVDFADAGFMADGLIGGHAVRDASQDQPSVYLEVISKRGDVGFQTVPECRLNGLAAITRILGAFSARYGDVPHAFGVVGPAIAQLNTERLRTPVIASTVQFGTPPERPLCSIIVPVHGRCEFVEDQMALFSRTPLSPRYEFIYVLDDPPRKSEFLSLSESIYNRFGIPMTVLLLAENVGFAPASNVGLAASHGAYICFLNSDVFPADDDWLMVLIERLRRHPKVGVIGPLLVFEDDTIQHCGMTFEPLVEFGSFQFPLHTNKGFIPAPARGLAMVGAITGACMVLARQAAMALRGFNETYIIGDFEDSDMCMRLRQSGRQCAVDPSVRLYHLERQSQLTARTPWRMNLTLYNAWQHEALWGTTIKAAKRKRAGVMAAAE